MYIFIDIVVKLHISLTESIRTDSADDLRVGCVCITIISHTYIHSNTSYMSCTNLCLNVVVHIDGSGFTEDLSSFNLISLYSFN